MDKKVSSKFQILIGIVTGILTGLIVFGGIFFFIRNPSYFQNFTNKFKSATTKTNTPVANLPIAEQTAGVRKKLNGTNHTVNWRTYQNTRLNFSIRYPQEVTHVTENIKTKQISFPMTTDCSAKICEGIYISVVNVPSGTDLKGALDKGLQGPNSAGQKGSTYEDIAIAGGIKGLETFKNGSGGGDFDRNSAYILKDTKLYVFDLYIGKEKAEEKIQNLNLMLKTFKFLK